MTLEATSTAAATQTAEIEDVDSLAAINVIFSGPSDALVYWSRKTLAICEGSDFRMTADFSQIPNFGTITGTPTITFDRPVNLNGSFKILRKNDRAEFRIWGGAEGLSTTFTVEVQDALARKVCGKGTIHVIDQSFGVASFAAVSTARTEQSATLT